MDLWAAVSRVAARRAGTVTADVLRIRAELAGLAELEADAGETFAGSAYRVALSAAELRREAWRELARRPVMVVMPPVAFAVILAVSRG